MLGQREAAAAAAGGGRDDTPTHDDDSRIIHAIGGGGSSVPGLSPAVLGGRSRRRGSFGESKVQKEDVGGAAAAPSVAPVESPYFPSAHAAQAL